MTEWERLTHNLYVNSHALKRAREEVDRLENEHVQLLDQLEACETSRRYFERCAPSAGEKP